MLVLTDIRSEEALKHRKKPRGDLQSRAVWNVVCRTYLGLRRRSSVVSSRSFSGSFKADRSMSDGQTRSARGQALAAPRKRGAGRYSNRRAQRPPRHLAVEHPRTGDSPC